MLPQGSIVFSPARSTGMQHYFRLDYPGVIARCLESKWQTRPLLRMSRCPAIRNEAVRLPARCID